MTHPVDLRPLAKALLAIIELDPDSKEAQAFELELALTAAEINPNPIEFCDLINSLIMISEIDTANAWHDQTDYALAPFFPNWY